MDEAVVQAFLEALAPVAKQAGLSQQLLRALRDRFSTGDEWANVRAAVAAIVAGRDSNVKAAREAGEERDIERLLRVDRESLRSFIANLKEGISLDDMEEDLKAWWISRF